MRVSDEKAAELQESIAALSKTSESLKQALIDSAARRKELERKIAAGEKKLAELGVSEDKIRRSFKDRRAILAEVLAALQRMGRNPPPALLVSPEDALASVRTAILLGAVVPGIRKETEKLAADLAELIRLRQEGQKETETLVATMASRQEEERRMDLLLVENDRLSRQNTLELARQPGVLHEQQVHAPPLLLTAGAGGPHCRTLLLASLLYQSYAAGQRARLPLS